MAVAVVEVEVGHFLCGADKGGRSGCPSGFPGPEQFSWRNKFTLQIPDGHPGPLSLLSARGSRKPEHEESGEGFALQGRTQASSPPNNLSVHCSTSQGKQAP